MSMHGAACADVNGDRMFSVKVCKGEEISQKAVLRPGVGEGRCLSQSVPVFIFASELSNGL